VRKPGPADITSPVAIVEWRLPYRSYKVPDILVMQSGCGILVYTGFESLRGILQICYQFVIENRTFMARYRLDKR
jgi:hypothetical protein